MKVTLEDMIRIKKEEEAFIDMRIPKSGNKIIIPYDEESKQLGSHDLLVSLVKENNKKLANIVIVKGEIIQGEFKKPVIIVKNNSKETYVYQEVTLEKAVKIYEEHGIGNQIIDEYNPILLQNDK